MRERRDWRGVPQEDWQFNVFSQVSGAFEFDPEVPEATRQEFAQRIEDTHRAFVLAQAEYRDAMLADPFGQRAERAFDGWWNAQEDKRILLEEIRDCTVGRSWTEVPDMDIRLRAFGLTTPDRPRPS